MSGNSRGLIHSPGCLKCLTLIEMSVSRGGGGICLDSTTKTGCFTENAVVKRFEIPILDRQANKEEHFETKHSKISALNNKH